MVTRALRVFVPGLLLPGFMSHAGGWAVITVDDLPDYAVAGTPVALSYVVRQHGQEPVDMLTARIEAVSGSAKTTTVARSANGRGRYTASLTLPHAGNWTVTIKSGFGNSNLTLLPIPVVSEASSLAVAVSDVERGKRLFVGKGCVTCHVDVKVGPPLDGRRFDPAYLAGFLEQPRRVTAAAPMVMPNLGLKQREIASLVAYLNSDRPVAAR
jgi:mono/diheme cytochrome c family protein